jgi:hypothetical protein
LEKEQGKIMNRKARRTPGPWRIYKDEYVEKSRFVIGEDGTLIADVYADYPDSNLGVPQAYEFPANARLIAAAPELLAALEYFYNIMRDYRSSVEKGYVKHALDMARDAIAKVEGRS